MPNFDKLPNNQVVEAIKLIVGVEGEDGGYIHTENGLPVKSLDYAHHEIHQGKNFRVQAFNDAVGAGGTLNLTWKTAPGYAYPHLIFEWVTESKGVVDLIEGPTVTLSSGTDIQPKNSRRDKQDVNLSGMYGCATAAWLADRVTKDATISGGTVISKKKIFTNDRAGGSSGVRRAEIILAPDTTYCLRFTNEDTGAKGCQLRMEWYQHTLQEFK